ncbi:hypothetical protein, partial [Stenotrophomonas maltophilia]|uniref:hypothetical protein n=4 Tax=Stenotrophomonas maltophilia TaxID=40324 RepID=UPI001A7E1A7A
FPWPPPQEEKEEDQKQRQQQQQQPRAVGWGQIRFPSENGSDPFLFSDTPHPRMAWKTNRHREIVGSGEGADGGTVHGMDAVAEPTGTYLRRVPPSAPSPPNQQKSRAAFEVVVAVA